MNASAFTYVNATRTFACSKTTPPPAKGGFPGNAGNHIATPLALGRFGPIPSIPTPFGGSRRDRARNTFCSEMEIM